MSTRTEFVPTKIWVERAAPIVEQVSQLRPYANKLSAELFTKQLLDVVVQTKLQSYQSAKDDVAFDLYCNVVEMVTADIKQFSLDKSVDFAKAKSFYVEMCAVRNKASAIKRKNGASSSRNEATIEISDTEEANYKGNPARGGRMITQV